MLTAAEWGYKGHVEGAQIAADASKYGSDNTLEGTKYGADASAGASMYGADQKLAGEQYFSDNQLEGTLAPKYSLSRAAGGPVKGKRPYLVGERGPELMVPKQSGTIIPNHNLREIARAIPRAGGGDVEAGGAPVEVIKGLNRTLAGGVPVAGRQGIYDRTSQRLQDFDTRVAQKETDRKSLLQATANIDPTGARTANLTQAATIGAAADKVDMADAQKTYKDAFQKDHAIGYTQDAVGTAKPIMPVDDNLNSIFLKGHGYVQAGTHTPEEAMQAIQPDLQKHYYTPENVDRALNAISQRTGQPITPQWRANAMSGTPEAMGALVPEIQKTLRQPKPGFWGSAVKNATTPANPFDAGQ